MLSALSSAPGARRADATSWAKQALQSELLYACATDRTASLMPGVETNEDLRLDIIVAEVKVGDGNAAVLGHGEGAESQLLAAYRFKVEVAFCISLSERPAPGAPPGDPADGRFMGDVHIPELVSGVLPDFEALTQRMRTSLRSPKPPKKHLAALRPLLERLERSLAYFSWRFEWSLLQRALQPAVANGS